MFYRDSDCMTAAEKGWLEQRYKENLPEKASIYLSDLTDIEHVFCTPEHISHTTGLSLEEAKDLVQNVIDTKQAEFASKLTLKRQELNQKALKSCPCRSSTEDVVGTGITFSTSVGKLLLSAVSRALQEKGKQPAMLLQQSPYLGNSELRKKLGIEDAVDPTPTAP
jgi:metal-dependent hydrolase (beta-lactamase superfamily II)